ncbi:MAG: ATP-binding protein [Actinomycetota bacterium]
MLTCPACGTDNPEQARFCMACASPLAIESSAPHDVRKTVTVVFADVTGSTSLGERLDPESTRHVMRRYFDAMSAVLERHGGTVEKFIGDAVMAVFGIPVLHEDDALRAVRAAVEMREALAELNRDLERDHGVTIAMRVGLDTGEVVAGDASAGQAMVTGDAVNIAARLEQNAQPGEILIGEATYRLVRDAVKSEPVDALVLKGKSAPVRTHKLLDIVAEPESIPRRLHSPMVGRARELMLLQLDLERAIDQSTCHLATVLGAAGVGKSRLVTEFIQSMNVGARVLTGRCLPYGDGITYWPVVQAVKDAAVITDDEAPEHAMDKIAALVESEDGADQIARRVGQLIGLAPGNPLPEEIFWAIRRFFEAMAKRGPLVLFFDDIHWASPTFLDLLEDFTDLARDASILVLCLGRQELLDLRPGWGGGKLNATSVLLEPLSEKQCEELIHNLLGRAELSESMRRRIAEAAEGNPLFVEEMLSTLIDDGLLVRGEGGWIPAGDLSDVKVPPTIHALLAARLDRLGTEERALIARASVMGRVFYRGAVTALSSSSEADAIEGHLTSLVRRELIRPQRSDFAGEDSYRFRHMMIRDAVYDAMPKETRADLHERFADWLEHAAGERVTEFEEIIGYHLERAHRYRAELGPVDAHGQEIAARAARVLSPAGLRALARGDVTGASNLLGRAVALFEPHDLDRVRLIPELASALLDLGEFDRVRALLSEPIPISGDRHQRGAGVRARLVGLQLMARTDPNTPYVTGAAEAEHLVSLAKEIGDQDTLLFAWSVLAHLRHWSGNTQGALEAIDNALAQAGSELDRWVQALHRALSSACVWGALPAEDGIKRWRASLERYQGAALEGFGWLALSALYAMTGDFARAFDYLPRARARLEQVGQKVIRATLHPAYIVYMLAGDPKGAADALRPGIAELTALGEIGYLSTSQALLAETLYSQGEYEEAEMWALKGRDTATLDDVLTHVLWRATEAKVLAQRGSFEEAERLSREAVDIIARTDYLNQHGDALMALATVLTLAGREPEAVPMIEEALGLYELKGNVVSARRCREQMDDSLRLRLPHRD